jgi:nicotinic acid mononucleotide adenylyltransferase
MVCVVGRIPDSARSFGILPGAFNPPTRAHQALLLAAQKVVECAVCVLPRAYPHKPLTGATLEERVAMLNRLGNTVAIADQGLFIDIAREFRRDLRSGAELFFICGRDAAERIVTWDYDLAVPPIAEQFREYRLLVARRGGEFEASAHLEHGVMTLDVEEDWDNVSSTEVRERIAAGEASWRELIPEPIADDVERIYRRGRSA